MEHAKRAARFTGRLILGLLLGLVISGVIGFGLDLVLSLAGIDVFDSTIYQIIGVVSGLIGWPLGLWLVFRRRKGDLRSPKPAVSAEQWGKRPQ